MGRYASDTGGGDFKQVDPGAHISRCFQIIDIGTHPGEYMGKPNRQNQIVLRFECCFEMETFDGVLKPMMVSAYATNSLSEKAKLRKYLESWRSREFTKEELERFDLENILGAACVLSIIHTDKGKAKVMGIAAVPKGTTVPPLFNPKSAFWIDAWDDAAFDALPKYYQEKIMESDEYKAMHKAPPGQRAAKDAAGFETNDIDDDSIPF